MTAKKKYKRTPHNLILAEKFIEMALVMLRKARQDDIRFAAASIDYAEKDMLEALGYHRKFVARYKKEVKK